MGLTHTSRRLGITSFGAATLACLALAPGAFAQATRTWISGLGDDANPCSRTAPCKTWPGAYSKTAVGGEIDVLDAGGFGTLNIGHSITIDGGGGFVSSALTNSGNAFSINAGANDRVVLRNIRMNGIGAAVSGVRFNSGGRLILENDAIFNFAGAGVDLESAPDSRTTIINTTIENNNGPGVLLSQAAAGNPARATVVKSNVIDNGCGLAASPAGGSCSSTASTGSPVLLSAYETLIADNIGAGVLATGPNGYDVVSGDEIVGNATGLSETGSPAGGIFSFGDNRITGNGTDGTPNIALTKHARDAGGAIAYVTAKARAYARAKARARARAKKRAHKRAV